MKSVRLDKFISENSKYSRSEIKRLTRASRVTVDGQIVKAADIHIDAACAVVAINGEEIKYKKYVYLALNKPAGILSASNDKNRKTVVDLVGEDYRHYDLFPVGRLDKDTTGLLILTNDGDFSYKLTHPKHEISKTYIAEVEGIPTAEEMRTFAKGVYIDGRKTYPENIIIVN